MTTPEPVPENESDYAYMEFWDLKALAKSRGIRGRYKRAKLIAELERLDGLESDPVVTTMADDRDHGIGNMIDAVTSEECGLEIPDAVRVDSGEIMSTSTHFRVQPYTRDAVRVVDANHNVIGVFYRWGKVMGNERVTLDMERNAKLCVKALNKSAMAFT